MDRRDTDIVTASEIGSWGWCPESWLDAVGAVPSNLAARKSGETTHENTALFEAESRKSMTLGRQLIAAAVVGLLLLLLRWLLG